MMRSKAVLNALLHVLRVARSWLVFWAVGTAPYRALGWGLCWLHTWLM
jgi:hypothetical protein